MELEERSGPLFEYLAGQQRLWFDSIGRMAAKCQREGVFRTDRPPEEFAFDLIGVTLAHHLHRRLFGGEEAADRAWQAFSRLLQQWNREG